MKPKPESDPISPDEWLIRLVWEDRVTDRVPVISPNAFEPRKNEMGGISFFRRDCLNAPTDALTVIAEEKRSRYAIVLVPVSLFTSLGLTVRPDRIDSVPGHVVVPEINITDYSADKARFTPIKLRLAEVASENMVHRPGDPLPPHPPADQP
jgi:hypothetical protein